MIDLDVMENVAAFTERLPRAPGKDRLQCNLLSKIPNFIEGFWCAAKHYMWAAVASRCGLPSLREWPTTLAGSGLQRLESSQRLESGRFSHTK